jgi:hypothetical protein
MQRFQPLLDPFYRGMFVQEGRRYAPLAVGLAFLDPLVLRHQRLIDVHGQQWPVGRLARNVRPVRQPDATPLEFREIQARAVLEALLHDGGVMDAAVVKPHAASLPQPILKVRGAPG